MVEYKVWGRLVVDFLYLGGSEEGASLLKWVS